MKVTNESLKAILKEETKSSPVKTQTIKLCESGTEEKKYKKQETSTNEQALPDWYSQKAWDP